LHPTPFPQQTLPLVLESSQELHTGFLSRLGLGVRAMNVLLQMDLKTAAQFFALDEHTLLRRRNCGKKTATEIMEAVTRYKAPREATSGETDAELRSAAIEQMPEMPVTDLRLSVRATTALERLKISTVGQLAKVSNRELLHVLNFGKKSLCEVQSKLAVLRSRGFVVWPVEQQTAARLSPHITRAARKLQRLRNASAVLCDDRRFGHLIREMVLDAKTARAAGDIILSRKVDPVNPQPLIRRLSELARNIKMASQMSLEEELWSLTDGLGINEIAKS
jgi:hypothetical protein